MGQVAPGDTVKVHYRGTLDDGSEFDCSKGSEPLEIRIGDGRVLPGFEQALVGMAPGETKTINLKVDEAYGPHEPGLVQQVERDRLPSDITLEVGRILETKDDTGRRRHLTIVEFSDDKVTLDANHPLAGKDLTFELELVEIG